MKKAALAFLAIATSLAAFTKSGTLYSTDGALPDVQGAIFDATNGDTIAIPPGTFTWGINGTFLTINKQITLKGSGSNATTIKIADDAPSGFGATIRITASAVVRDFATINATSGYAHTIFECSGANGWRICHVTHTSSRSAGYFVYASSYGLIDNCDITGADGSDELIFARGPGDSWQTPTTGGSANAVYIEHNTFRGPGYVCDFNSNARGVVRFNTISGPMKVDGHGLFSNTPPRSVRSMEVYNNIWTHGSDYYTSIEIRGGTGWIFGNTATKLGWLQLVDYTVANGVATRANWPIDDQIGVGPDPKSGGSEPLYLWSNRRAGDATTPWGVNQYSYDMTGVINTDRDYYNECSPFSGSSGVGIGTASQMAAIKPSKSGVGYWVTDEGSWNTELPPNTSGRFYRWNGSTWTISYTPYTYPHPAITKTEILPLVPNITPGAWEYPQIVSFSVYPSDASIRYTIDGTNPTSSYGLVYNGSVTVLSSATVKAIAFKPSVISSPVFSGNYTITGQCATPTTDIPTAEYFGAQVVTLKTTTPGASIYYTTDGAEPTSNSLLYSSAISVSSTRLIKAVAIKSDLTASSVLTAAITISLTVGNRNPGPNMARLDGTRNEVIPFVASATGKLQTVSIYGTNTSSTQDFKFALYRDINQNRENLTISSESPIEFKDVGTWALGWKEFVVNFQVTEGQRYWLGFQVSELNSTTVYYEPHYGSEGIHFMGRSGAYSDPWAQAEGNTSWTEGNRYSLKGVLTPAQVSMVPPSVNIKVTVDPIK